MLGRTDTLFRPELVQKVTPLLTPGMTMLHIVDTIVADRYCSFFTVSDIQAARTWCTDTVVDRCAHDGQGHTGATLTVTVRNTNPGRPEDAELTLTVLRVLMNMTRIVAHRTSTLMTVINNQAARRATTDIDHIEGNPLSTRRVVPDHQKEENDRMAYSLF